MKSSHGNKIKYTLFGESHSKEIGIIISGIEAGFEIDFESIKSQLELRQGMEVYNTARQEKPEFIIKSGFDGCVTTGEEIEIVFENNQANSKDYSNLINTPRPGHADYVSMMKYGKENIGGGHFSGRMSAPIVVLGQICFQLIKKSYPDFDVVSHISEFQNLKDISYYEIRNEFVKTHNDNHELLKSELHKKILTYDNVVFDNEIYKSINSKAVALTKEETTAGGKIETIIINPPSFIGEPFFETVEGNISKLLFSIPSVKGVSFGYGEEFVNTKGHLVKDEFTFFDEESAYTLYNYNGGINGGITNGEDIVFSTVLKPISSLMQTQTTYNKELGKQEELVIKGRHDATIVNRVIPVIDSVTCIALYELLQYKRK